MQNRAIKKFKEVILPMMLAVIVIVIAAAGVLSLSGCATTAETVNHNLSKEADEFNVYRRITVTNARTDTIMLQAEGYMSLGNNSSGELVVTIRVGDNTYYKDYIYLNDWTCYTVEQVEPNYVDKYHYEFVFYPERILPEIELK